MKKNHNSVLNLFLKARDDVLCAGYDWEIDWQRNRSLFGFSENEFLRECAWVILCSGFKESVVRRCFDYVSLCHYDWESAEIIASNSDRCFNTAFSAFKNTKKLNAIGEIAKILSRDGFSHWKQKIMDNPVRSLLDLPYIGPVTSYHLAKNLGANVAKNDRHLDRIAKNYGFDDGHYLCKEISDLTGEDVNVVDLILWRFSTLKVSALS